MADAIITANDNNLSFAKIEEVANKFIVHDACGFKQQIRNMKLGDFEKVCEGFCPLLDLRK